MKILTYGNLRDTKSWEDSKSGPKCDPHTGRGGWCTPKGFFRWTLNRLPERAEILHSLWGVLCASFGEKIDQVRSGHRAMTSWGTISGQIWAKSWIIALLRAIPTQQGLASVRKWLLTTPAHCTVTYSRSFKVKVRSVKFGWKISNFPEIWPLTCHNWVKYWPRNNFYVQSQDLVESNPLFFFR